MRRPIAFLLFASCLWAPDSVQAWTPDTQISIARTAARFAPRDFARQIEKHIFRLQEGVRDAVLAPRSGLPIPQVLQDESNRAVQAIRNHRPFQDIVHQLGVVSYYAAVANQPLFVSDADPAENRYSLDYPRYVESARLRFALTFEGAGRDLVESDDVLALARGAIARGRAYYPMIAREYERIGYGKGRELFDDRSTAFGTSALAYSHAVSDVIALYRWIWVQAGGGDPRQFRNLTPPTK